MTLAPPAPPEQVQLVSVRSYLTDAELEQLDFILDRATARARADSSAPDIAGDVASATAGEQDHLAETLRGP